MRSVIYLIGPAGVGKYTIAKEIVLRCPELKLIHNHHINNVIFDIVKKGDGARVPGYVWESVRMVRTAVLNTIRKANCNDGYIFTNVLMQDFPGHLDIYTEIRDTAHAKGMAFCPVRLSIELAELCKRMAAPERASMMKDTNVDSATKTYDMWKTFIPPDNFLELDVTELGARHSAEQIIQWVAGSMKLASPPIRIPIVRAAQQSDAPGLARLLSQLAQENLDDIGIVVDTTPVLPEHAAAILQLLWSQGSTLFIAEIDCVIAGFLLLGQPEDNDDTRFAGITIAVEAAHRRFGVGTALLTAAKDSLIAAGACGLCLTVRKHNAPAIALYRKTGFETVEETESGIRMIWKNQRPGRA